MKIPKTGWANIVIIGHLTWRTSSWGKLTVTKESCKDYWCSTVVRTEEERPVRANPVKYETIGIDTGIKDYVIMSDSTKYVNPKYLEE